MFLHFLATICFIPNVIALKCYFDRLPENVKSNNRVEKMKECPREVSDCVTITTSLEINSEWEVYVERRCAHSKFECVGSQNTCQTLEAEPVWGRRKVEKRCCYNDRFNDQSRNSLSMSFLLIILFLIAR